MQNTKIINGFPFTKYSKKTFPSNESIRKGTDFYRWMDERRSVRDFSYKPFAKGSDRTYFINGKHCPKWGT